MERHLHKNIVYVIFVQTAFHTHHETGPVYTIPFSFDIRLGKAIRYENFSCLHDAVFIS